MPVISDPQNNPSGPETVVVVFIVLACVILILLLARIALRNQAKHRASLANKLPSTHGGPSPEVAAELEVLNAREERRRGERLAALAQSRILEGGAVARQPSEREQGLPSYAEVDRDELVRLEEEGQRLLPLAPEEAHLREEKGRPPRYGEV